ncbi:MAG TPA: GNAT family N-acetyltransferase [Ktedonobacterales bacterium]|nr:GNAT family N-acetyltransferase [Ktedonobacterales bacterium]
MAASNVSIAVVGPNPAHIEQALSVLQEGLGDEFITREHVMRYGAPPTRRPFRRALVALDDATQSVLGVLLIEIVGATALRASFLHSYDLVRHEADIQLFRPGRTGHIASIVVAPANQGRGIATQLVRHGVQELTDHGAEHCYSLAWTSEQHGCHLCGVLTSVGFRSVRCIERFWYQDSLIHGYSCVLCGRPCTCAVHVMVR